MWFILPLIGLGVGITALATFQDVIREWWTQFIDPMLEKYGLDSLRKGFVEFDKGVVRARRAFKRAIAYFKISKEKAVKRVTEEEILITDLPEEIQKSMHTHDKGVLEMTNGN